MMDLGMKAGQDDLGWLRMDMDMTTGSEIILRCHWCDWPAPCLFFFLHQVALRIQLKIVRCVLLQTDK